MSEPQRKQVEFMVWRRHKNWLWTAHDKNGKIKSSNYRAEKERPGKVL